MDASGRWLPMVAFIFRWIARLAAVAMFGLFVAFAVGEGFPPLWKQPLAVQLIFLGWGLIFIGYVVGWWRQLLGGMLVFVALVGMYLVEFAASGHLLGSAFLMWLVPGVLYLIAGWLERRGGRAAIY